MERSVWIGWDPREAAAFAVARHSIIGCANRRHVAKSIYGVVLSDLRKAGLYYRPTSQRGPQMWDDISDAPMSTEFACSRFLVTHLAKAKCRDGDFNGYRQRWALFMDCDMLIRADINALFESCDPTKAVMVVKHDHQPEGGMKMDGQIQTRYARKNWSSVCAFNLGHEANEALTVELANTVPGRDLHGFCWLQDDEIGELGAEWNYLVGHTEIDTDPKIVHFTDGIPQMAGYENCDYADEWRDELDSWAAK